jgi:hypothetical protein
LKNLLHPDFSSACASSSSSFISASFLRAKSLRYALDRIPTTEEIREILDASNIRSKALTLVLVSSGIREGATEMLRVGDYSHIKREGETVAGRPAYCVLGLSKPEGIIL